MDRDKTFKFTLSIRLFPSIFFAMIVTPSKVSCSGGWRKLFLITISADVSALCMRYRAACRKNKLEFFQKKVAFF